MRRGDDADPRKPEPLFFLSYAHTSRGQQNRIKQFFEDLSENVAELVSRQVGADPGFMDRTMGGGNHWSAELLEAVGTCHVFVPLLSTPYLTSTWCGMEWFAFSRRQVVRRSGARSDHQTAIVPVVWAAPVQGPLPKVVGNVQRFTLNLANTDMTRHHEEEYEEEGVGGLLRIRADSYDTVVWKLAQRIAGLYYEYSVDPLVLREVDLRDIFQEGHA